MRASKKETDEELKDLTDRLLALPTERQLAFTHAMLAGETDHKCIKLLIELQTVLENKLKKAA